MDFYQPLNLVVIQSINQSIDLFIHRDAEERYEKSQRQLDENKQNIKDLENQIDELKADVSDERKKRKG